MPTHKYITDEALALLTEIGFPAEPLMRGDLRVSHSRHHVLIVNINGCVVLDPDAFTFKLCTSIGVYEDVKIPVRIVAQRKRFWRKTVMRWYMKAILSLSEIRRRREKEESDKRMERERILSRLAQHIPSDLDVSPEQVFEVLPMRLDEEDNLDTVNYSHHVRLDIENEPNSTRIAQMARLVVFLRRENIKYS